ncbi:RNA polymerase sigma factor [Rhodopirellula sallentina]|uniref:RNA polymerase, sigma-24 subunit, ECF subfamily n=1 Tax=Rhodopirellula sallentina SM41 TaxID=1263870 RepID=M5TT26_9BACT|nr:sigma-70 family RNA polymerase sigma factor [Rhodopirellula sallentina]EMI52310.1 RNA polymerase, sigma-24 subunit, ECF subfamily [Rhodopirellula sallentina SM41]
MNADETLIARIESRDVEALAEYIAIHRDKLAGFVRSITGEHLLAVTELDDLIQEISATAIAGLSSAPLEQYAPMQWLQQIARRRVVDAHRFHFDAKIRDFSKQKSLHAPATSAGGSGDEGDGGLERLLAASMTSPSAAVSRDVRMHRMSEAIGTLNEDQQRAIRLRYVEGLPTKAIAEELGKTDVAVRVLLSRSMRELEKQLEDVRPTR